MLREAVSVLTDAMARDRRDGTCGCPQAIAQSGVTSAFTLMASHEDAVERVARGLKQNYTMAQLIAEIEAANVR
jgi:hypothetical protein